MSAPVFATSTGSTESSPKPPGRLTALLVKWLFRRATVSQVEVLSEHFRWITLAGEELKAVTWTPGQKIQISVSGDANRTYTPVSWDAIAGQARILAYSHGEGPGAVWASTVMVNAACQFFGPRHSLSRDDDRIFLFGDETSFGLALALSANLSHGGAAALLFEVSSLEDSKRVWQACSSQPACFITRIPGDTHLEAVEAQMLRIIDELGPDRFVLSGKGTSIQRLRRALKVHGIASTQMRTKAHWAPGKTGLD